MPKEVDGSSTQSQHLNPAQSADLTSGDEESCLTVLAIDIRAIKHPLKGQTNYISCIFVSWHPQDNHQISAMDQTAFHQGWRI